MHRSSCGLALARGALLGPLARRPGPGRFFSSSSSSATPAGSSHRRRRPALLVGSVTAAAAAAATASCMHGSGAGSVAHMSKLSGGAAVRVPATADLCDEHVPDQPPPPQPATSSGPPPLLQVADPSVAFRAFGQHGTFGGEIRTVKCFENNPLVRSTLSEPGAGKVLVVDGGGSLRRALFGDNIAALAVQNGWAGVVIYGAIRDSEQIDQMPLGVRALGTNPIKSAKQHPGDKDVPVAFAGVTFTPGHFVYVDRDGIVVSPKRLH